MLRTSICILTLMLVVASVVFTHSEERRIALVLHNIESYDFFWKTSESIKVPDITLTLNKLGFDVIESIEPDQATLAMKIRQFAQLAKKADVAVVYYMGRIAQISGRNYLIPSGIKEIRPSQLSFKAVALDPLLHELQRLTKTNFVFLNACRHRFPPTGNHMSCPGLQPLKTYKDMMVAYANEPHNTVMFEKQTQKSFARALLANLSREDVPIHKIMDSIRAEVASKTQAKQLPWSDNTLKRQFVFNVKKLAPANSKFSRQTKVASWIPTAHSLTEKNQVHISKRPDFRKQYMSLLSGRTLKMVAIYNPVPTLREVVHPYSYRREPDFIDPNTDIKVVTKKIQQHLHGFGCYQAGIDGIWGRGSKRALLQFKSYLNLKHLLSHKPGTELLKLVSSYSGAICDPRDVIRKVQNQLAHFECYKMKVDGLWGRFSRKALLQFQQNASLQKISVKAPNLSLLELLAAYSGPICGKVCGKEQREDRTGLCVQITQPKNAQELLAKLNLGQELVYSVPRSKSKTRAHKALNRVRASQKRKAYKRVYTKKRRLKKRYRRKLALVSKRTGRYARSVKKKRVYNFRMNDL
ncbi:MAG: caspase family protein [Pseudomonadota bacterium]